MFRPGRIVLIDDDSTSRLKLSAAVAALGHEVMSAVDGRSGITLAAEEAADLVLLDLIMPDFDGFDVLRAMTADPGLRNVPVLVVSATEEIAEIAEAIELGAEDVLPKSFDPVLLRARIDAALERRRLQLAEAEYLEEVDRLSAAAQIIEATDFNPSRLGLGALSDRSDDLGRFAQVFLGMADRIYLREAAYRQRIGLLIGALLLIAFGAVKGLQPALARILGQTAVDPLGLAAASLIAGAVFMAGVTSLGRNWERPGRSQVVDLLLYGLLACAVPRVLLLFAATEIPAVMISLLLATEALMVYLIAAAIGAETRSLRRLLGLATGFGGILLVLLLPGLSPGLVSAGWPFAFAMLAPVAYAVGKIVLAVRSSGPRSNSVVNTTMMLAFAALAVSAVAYANGSWLPAEVLRGDIGMLAAALGAVGALGQLLLIVTVRLTGAVFASQSGYTATAGGVLWAVLLLGESLNWATWVALGTLFLGLVLVMPKREEEDLEAIFSARPELDAARARLGL